MTDTVAGWSGAGTVRVTMLRFLQPRNPNKHRRYSTTVAVAVVVGTLGVYTMSQKPWENSTTSRATDHVGSIDTQLCQAQQAREECVALLLTDLAVSDPEQALRAYTAAVGEGAEAFQNCHGAHHILGKSAGAAHSISALVDVAPTTCGRGFIHGAIDGYLETLDSPQDSTAGFEICKTIETMTGDELMYKDCVHAVGHRIASSGAVFDEIEQLCALGEKVVLVSCTSGGFMGLLGQKIGVGESRGKDIEEYARMCNTTTKDAAQGCWQAALAVFAGSIESVPPDTMAKICLEGSSPTHCSRSAGEAYGLLAIGEDGTAVAKIVAWCAPMSELEEACLGGAVSSLLGAVKQGVVSHEDFQASIEREIPAEYLQTWGFGDAQRLSP